MLGTGIMGRAMAANLAAAGHDTIVYNRTRDRAEGIAGTTVADSPEGAVAGRDAVVTMLVDADSVLDVMTDDVLRATGDAVWLQMSTVGDGIERLAAAADEHAVAFVDAPVAGTKQPAIDGTLTVLAAGPTTVRDVADQVFDAVGQRTVWLGESAGPASRMKLLVNGVLVHQVAAIAEGLRAATALGIEPANLLRVLDGGPLGSPVIAAKGQLMLDESFDATSPSSTPARTRGCSSRRPSPRARRFPSRPPSRRCTTERSTRATAARTWRRSSWASTADPRPPCGGGFDGDPRRRARHPLLQPPNGQPMPDPANDLVLYGATSFVGQITAQLPVRPPRCGR